MDSRNLATNAQNMPEGTRSEMPEETGKNGPSLAEIHERALETRKVNLKERPKSDVDNREHTAEQTWKAGSCSSPTAAETFLSQPDR